MKREFISLLQIKLEQGFALPFAEVHEVPVEVPLVYQPLIPVW